MAALPDTVVSLIRFEEDTAMPYADDLNALDELFTSPGCTRPGQESGPIGFAATFAPASSQCIQAKDLTVGGTALPRDVSVSVVMTWDIAAQNAAGTTGTIIARGKGNGATEYMPFALELHVVNAGAKIGEVRWLWNTIAGVLKTETGGAFVVPSDWFILTATRRWISPTNVVIRYYLNDQLLSQVVSVDGDIAASVDGTTTIGGRYTGAAYANFLAGAIDELAIANYEICLEEITATYARIGNHQSDGYRLMKELMPPGMPISDDPKSRAQGDLASMGIALGFSSGMIENFRQNIMPDRAFGSILRRWEAITRQPARQGDALDTRRSRVVGHMKGRAGVSVSGVQTALASLLDTGAVNLQVFAFDNTVRDTFAALDNLKWRYAAAADWSVLANESRVQAAAGSYPWNESAPFGGKSALIAVEAPRAAHLNTPTNALSIFASMDPHALPANAESGVCFFDWVNQSVLFFGVRNTAGAYTIGYQRYQYGLATDGAWQVLAATALQKHWLRIRPFTGFFAGTILQQKYDLSYSTIGQLEANLTTASVVHLRSIGWAGFYFRTFGATASAADVRFGSFALRNGLGTRPFYFYVYRDPALGGNPDIAGAERVLNRMKHAFTKACVVTAKIALFDDPASTFDCTPLGME